MPAIEQNVPIDRPVSFTKMYATNAVVAMTEFDIRVEFLNEKMQVGKGNNWVYISEGMAILTPLAARRLRDALSDKIEQYEKRCGKIRESEHLPVMYRTVEKQRKSKPKKLK